MYVYTDLALAKEILSRFDVILIMDWLDDPEMAQHFDSVLGTKGTTFPHENLAKDKREAHQKEPLDEATVQRVRELNRFDSELYEWAKNLTKSRMEATRRRLDEQQHQNQNEEERGKNKSSAEVAAFDLSKCRPLPPIPEFTVHGIAYADLKKMPVRYPPLCDHPLYLEGEREQIAAGEQKDNKAN